MTQNQLHRSSLTAVNDARVRMQDAQRVAMSGERVSRASDDPTAAARARLIDELRTATGSHQQNISYGLSRLQTGEQALGEAEHVLIRARELTLAASNETLTAQQRAGIAAEVRQLRSTLVDLVNTEHMGEHIFAHVATQTPPYDDGTDSFSYDVDAYADVRRADVGPSQTAEIGVSGSRAFAQRAADPTSVDVIGTLDQLAADLEANDVDAVRSGLDAVDRAFDQVLAERSRAGVRIQRLRQADDAAQQTMTVYTSLRGDLVDADAAEAFSNLTLTETTMQAAVTVAARILGPSLLDVL